MLPVLPPVRVHVVEEEPLLNHTGHVRLQILLTLPQHSGLNLHKSQARTENNVYIR
jgi:hypothetical protein